MRAIMLEGTGAIMPDRAGAIMLEWARAILLELAGSHGQLSIKYQCTYIDIWEIIDIWNLYRHNIVDVSSFTSHSTNNYTVYQIYRNRRPNFS